jgi:hypothetical protein
MGTIWVEKNEREETFISDKRNGSFNPVSYGQSPHLLLVKELSPYTNIARLTVEKHAECGIAV